MLSGNSCSPCHIFDSRADFHERLSAEHLKDVLRWATNLEPELPEIIFLADANDPIEQFHHCGAARHCRAGRHTP